MNSNHSKTPRFLSVLITILILTTSSSIAGLVRIESASGRVIEALPNQVLVRYKPGRSASAKNKLQSQFRIQSQKSIEAIQVEVLPVPEGESLQSFLKKLEADPDIEFAEPNGVLRAFTAPNDPNYSSQYSLGSGFINVEPAWDITQGSSTVVLADIDTGVTLTHPDLAANLWVNPSPSGNSGLNGTRIEINWNNDSDCTDTDPDLGPEQCASSDPTDNNNPTYHGTRVAGIMAAVTNNGLNMAGIARNCRIMAIKALNSSGAGSFTAIAEAILYAANNGASVINLSLGGSSGSSAVNSAVDYAINQKNVVVVAAAGNDGNSSPVNFPASISQVIAVGATDSGNSLAFFSCTGNALDLVAPGVGIMSTIPAASSNNNADGTSFSSPMVAGVAGLIRSLYPNMSVTDVTRYINFTATDLGPSGFDTSFGFGLLNAYNAVRSANTGTVFVSNPASPNETFPYPNPFQPGPGQTLTISLPNSLGSEGIKINIYNTAGDLIKELNNTNTWDGRNEEGNTIASGLYFYIAKTSRGEAKGKLTVLK